MQPSITATGAAGFLQWMSQDQPAFYQAVLPYIMKNVPDLWTDYSQSQTMGRLFAGLGQDDDEEEEDIESSDADIEAAEDYDDDSTDDDAEEEDIESSDADIELAETYDPTTTTTTTSSDDANLEDEDIAQSDADIAAAENYGTTTATTTSAAATTANTSMTPAQASDVQSIITSVLGPTAGTEVGKLYTSLTGQQLTNAVASLPPTSATSSASGIGTLVSDATSSPGILIGIGALALIGIIIATSSSSSPSQPAGGSR